MLIELRPVIGADWREDKASDQIGRVSERPIARVTSFNAPTLFNLGRMAYWRSLMWSPASDVSPGVDDAIVAIIFSAATIEAIVNTLEHIAGMPYFAPDGSLQPVADVLTEAESAHVSVRGKYLLSMALLTGVSVDKGSRPYQDLDLLLKLRDNIIHHKPAQITDTPHRLVQSMQAKGLCAPPPGEVDDSWLKVISTRAAGRWAINTAVAVGRSLCESEKVSAPMRFVLCDWLKEADDLSPQPLPQRPPG